LRLKPVHAAEDECRSALGLDGGYPDLHVRWRALLAVYERPRWAYSSAQMTSAPAGAVGGVPNW
jgi:hypothetical protein